MPETVNKLLIPVIAAGGVAAFPDWLFNSLLRQKIDGFGYQGVEQINANQQGLFGELGDLSNERAAAKTLQHADITAIPCLKTAAGIWGRVLANIYFILFPDVIIFSGPFTHNEALFREITTGFSQHVSDYFEQNVTFTINYKSYMNEMHGALSPFFDALVAEYCHQGS